MGPAGTGSTMATNGYMGNQVPLSSSDLGSSPEKLFINQMVGSLKGAGFRCA